jgi:hypothetical protein
MKSAVTPCSSVVCTRMRETSRFYAQGLRADQSKTKQGTVLSSRICRRVALATGDTDIPMAICERIVYNICEPRRLTNL